MCCTYWRFALWEAVERLERYGFRVLAVTADGGSPNRRLFKIHCPAPNSEVMYKVKNLFANGRSVLFFSDPPHLIKTVRNCLASTKRSQWVSLIYHKITCFARIQCNGSDIKWDHIANLYHSGNGAQTNTPGVPCFLHKLKFEHIRLTSFSKMRVDLAAQVCTVECFSCNLHSKTVYRC